jgi:hypothetical protein
VAAALAATAVTAGVIVAAWIVIGPTGFAFAWVFHCMLMFWVVVAWEARPTPLTSRWFRVRTWEATVYRAVGVRRYGRALDAIGWNARITRDRGFDRTRAGLRVLDRHTRRSEAGHLWCLLVTVVVAGVVAATDGWNGVGWLAGLAVLLHLYPVMLQRLLRTRIRAVLDASSTP